MPGERHTWRKPFAIVFKTMSEVVDAIALATPKILRPIGRGLYEMAGMMDEHQDYVNDMRAAEKIEATVNVLKE